MLAEQGGRLAVLSAEGGIFSILAGRYSGGTPSIEVFLKGHAGDLLRIDRKGRAPEHVARPALTLGLTVQPEVLRAIAHMPGFRGRGLLARILYSVPENKVGRRKVGTDPVPVEVSERYQTNLRTLVMTLAEWTDPAVLTLTAPAAEMLLEAERDLEPRLAPEGDLGHMADWGAKLIGATARIAGLVHLAEHLTDGWGKPISEGSMSSAISIGRYFVEQARAAFSHMGVDPIVEDARAVGAWASEQETFTRRDVHRAHQSRFTKARDVDPVLELLEELGWIRRGEDIPRSPKGGRPPTPTYLVNPLLSTRKL